MSCFTISGVYKQNIDEKVKEFDHDCDARFQQHRNHRHEGV
jgi:hypothetical protein